MERRLDRTSDVYLGTQGNPVFQQHHRQRIHWMASQARGRVLDVGCSQGIVSILLAREGHEVVGVDIEPEVIEQARQALAQEPAAVQGRVQFVVGNFLAGGAELGEFNTVIAGEILEHLVQPAQLVQRCYQVLKPGGLFIVTVPFGVHPFPDHKHTFYLRSLAQTLAPHFSLEQVELLHVPAGGDVPVPIIGAVAKRLARPAQPNRAQAAQWLEFSEQGFAVTERRYLAQLENVRGQVENLRKRAETNTADLKTARDRVSELGKEASQLRLEREQQASAASTLLEVVADTAGRVAKLLGLVTPTSSPQDALGKRVTAAAMTGQAAAVAVESVLADRARLAEEVAHLGKAADELRQQVAAREAAEHELRHQLEQLQQQGRAQAEAEKELHRHLAEVQLQATAQADVEKQLRGQLGELQQQATAQAGVEKQLRAQLEGLQQQAAAQAGVEKELRAHLEGLQQQATAQADAEKQLRAQLEALQQQAVAQAGVEKELRGQLEQLQQQGRAQAEAERDLYRQLGEFQQQSRAQAELEQDLRGQLQELQQQAAAQADAETQLRHHLDGLERQAHAQAELEQGLRGQLQELRRQATAQADVETQLRHQLQELQQQAHAQVEVERTLRQQVAELRRRAEAQSKAEQKLRDQLASVQSDAAAHAKAADALRKHLGLAQEDLDAAAELEKQLRDICRERDRGIRQLRWKLGMMEDSTSYRVGLLIVRSIQRPYRLLAMPFGAISLLVSDALANRRRKGGAEEARLAELPAPLSDIPSPVKRKSSAVIAVEDLRAAPAAPVQMPASAPAPAPALTASPAQEEKTRLLLSGLYEQPRRVQDLRMAVIMDEFSLECFRPECQVITFRPDNWEPILSRERPHFLLVESAWKGNSGSWEYRIASYAYPGREELERLVAWCRQRKIPTVFWNKEDPVHFDRFIETAKLFDVVFTTDANCIPAYRKAVGHDCMYPLPFAAQPRLHNPTCVPGYREGPVCFAGSYYRNRHPKRREEMDWLLEAAMPFGLRIYDRGYGQTGRGTEHFTFPEQFAPAILGSLPYRDVVKAYKRYKVFLNVNSVADSPTMFSRRVFELLACGTPVVSTPAQGIEELLGREVVQLVSSPKEATQRLQRLLGDDRARERIGLAGQRLVAERHTYAHRLREVASRLGYRIAVPELPRVSVITWASDEQRMQEAVARLVAQNGTASDLVLVATRDVCAAAKQALAHTPLGERSAVLPVSDPADSAGWWKEALQEAASDFIALLSPDDHYGPGYLSDLARAIAYTGADAVGKAAHYMRNGGGVELVGDGGEYRFVDSLVPAAMLAKREVTAELGPLEGSLDKGGVLKAMSAAGARFFAADRFNYVRGTDAGSVPEVDL